MPDQILSTSNGTAPGDYFHVADSDDLIMAVANTTGTVHAEIEVDGNDLLVSGSSVDGEGTISLDLVPDGCSLRAVPSNDSADAYLFGNYYGQ